MNFTNAKVITPILIATVGGCASTEHFVPAERATARSPEGFVAADYEMSVDGTPLGDAVVWSDGAKETEIAGKKVPAIHVGFRIENRSNTALEIAPADLNLHITSDDRTVRRAQPDRVEGSRSVNPGEEGELSLYFALPGDLRARDVDAFRIEWKAIAGDLTYTQRTPFLEHTPPRYVATAPYRATYYYSPFYDPFLCSPFLYRGGLIVHGRPFFHRHGYIIPRHRRYRHH